VTTPSTQARFSMQRIWKLRMAAVVLTALAAAGSVADQPLGDPVDKDPGAPPKNSSSVELDDPIAPLVPLHERSGRDGDRVRALGLFAAGRVAEQKQDYRQALRDYQRALRLDPEAVPALREIVPLAFNLDRQAEAVRYALIMAEREPSDPVLLRRLAVY